MTDADPWLEAEMVGRPNDHWECDGDCGCGVCVAPGQTPEPAQHVVHGGRVCGTFVYDGECEACRAAGRRNWSG